MNSVNKTLCIPLYGKAYVSKKGLFLADKKAEEIWEAEGFSLKGKSRSKWLSSYMGVRSAVFDQWLKQQMAQAPDAVVLHIGCGMIYKTTFDSPLGIITLGSDGENLTGLWIQGQTPYPGEMITDDTLAIFDAAKDWLARYFDGGKPAIEELPLAPAGGEFRQAVWAILKEIPYGQVTTYGEIARKIASQRGINKMSAQAVGGAVGHNPISIIIPCHRVIGADGSMTGYGGGIDLKIQLLQHEGIDMKNFKAAVR